MDAVVERIMQIIDDDDDDDDDDEEFSFMEYHKTRKTR